MESFQVGDRVKFKHPQTVRTLTILNHADDEILNGTHVVTKVESVSTKCTCGAMYGYPHDEDCSVYAIRSVGHCQWVFTTAEPGQRWSGYWFTHSQIPAAISE
jgi:hypothetical protein